MRRQLGLRAACRRWSSQSDAVQKVWNENYYQKVADLETARPLPADQILRAKQVVRYYWDHTMHGLRAAWADTKKLARPGADAGGAAERLRRAGMRRELLKFLPYSVFVLVPFAELLLPFYVWLLPNMTPHYFKTTDSLGRGEAAEREAQERAHQRLEAHLLQHLHVNLADTLRAQSVDELRKADERVVAHLQENWSSYEGVLGPAAFDSELALAALHFFRAPHLTGTYLLNQLLNLHVMLLNAFFWLIRIPTRATKNVFRFDFWPVEPWLAAFYKWQLTRHVAALRRADEGFDAEMLRRLDFFESWRFMAERGIFAPSRQNAEAQYLQLWRAQPQENPYIALWAQVLRRSYAQKVAS